MVALRVELVGDRVGLILNDEARAALNVQLGEMVHLHRSANGGLVLEGADVGDDGRHERGRAFLKRYRRSLERFSG